MRRNEIALLALFLTGCQSPPTHPPALGDPGNGGPPPNGGTQANDGGAGATLLDGATTPTVLASGLAAPTALALGPSDVFWTDAAGGVWSVPRAGGTKASIATAQVAPVNIVANAALGTLYWANSGNGAMGGGSIVGFALGTGTSTTLAANLVQPYGLAYDSQFVYWTDVSTVQPGVEVAQVPTAGGAALEIGEGTGDLSPGGLAIDTANAYFASSLAGGGGSIATVPLAGGTPDTLWESAAGQPSGVVLGSAALYWLISSPAPQGAIWGVTLPGGKPAALVTGLNSPRQLAVDATNLYWTNPGEGLVSATPLAGGTPLTLASGLSSPGAIAVDDAVYVATASSIVRVPK